MNAPQAPDPYATAAAQTKSNEQTANYQTGLNMVNQVTPYGSINYNQTGTGPSGAPQYTATTTLSQPMQNLVNSNISNAQGNADVEGNLLKNVGSTLSQPIDLSYGANEGRLDQLAKNTIDPQYNQASENLQQSLMNRGLTPGSQGYEYAMDEFNRDKSNAYNNMYLQGHQTAVNDALTQYNLPLNELNALRTGSQVSQPGVGQTAQTPQTNVAGTNLAGLVEQNYQDQTQQYDATMGGLFGLGGAAIGARGANGAGLFGLLSDKRVKTDIERVGTLDNGLPVYSYRYIWGGPVQIGLMAQDVEQVNPAAVGEFAGFKTVDYKLATEV